jgi:hypothetical protein
MEKLIVRRYINNAHIIEKRRKKEKKEKTTFRLIFYGSASRSLH